MQELTDKLALLANRVVGLGEKINIGEKQAELDNLRNECGASGFWQDDRHAQKVMKQIALLEDDINIIGYCNEKIKEWRDLVELADKDNGFQADLLIEAIAAVKDIESRLNEVEEKWCLSGPYDGMDAIMSIHAGQGGVEAQDWAEMLLRMYKRFLERRKFKVEWVSESRGEEAGIKSVTLLIFGTKAYGLLRREAGTHRLVRLSPFNADNLRQTSFALVEILPQIEKTEAVEIKDEDLEWQFFKAGGHGGQNVNKVSSAVRLKHVPSNLVVEARTERFQEQNRKYALSLLRAKLWQINELNREKELGELRGDNKKASWGMQIRNYVLHPYQLVKDVRTEVETSDTIGVLDGEIDQFIEAEVRLLD